ncbi:aromatic acid exporter family protein [Laceyella putida]|uniref:Aromatic acid exporter family protein n=1 Tax=Laceyella putida TaxID=110101 RepID=A0ABW2RPA5_9BACL
MKIGYRTVKTAVGTTLSLAIAQWLGLQFYSSAAIITILCIKTTKKKSYQTAWERIVGFALGMATSTIIFELIGYHAWALALVLLAFIPLCVKLNATDGIISATVIILHLYLLKHVSLAIVLNEILLLVIGIGMAMLANWHMPSNERKLKESQAKIEANFRTILHEFAAYLREGNQHWDGKEITETARLLKEAKSLALRDIENVAPYDCAYYYRYFEMRERQFEILERIAPSVSSLDQCCQQGKLIGDFLDRLANAVHPGNTASYYLEELEQMSDRFKASPLPQTREEFETRAALYHFVGEMKRYLKIKRDLWIKQKKKEETEKHKLNRTK